MDEIIQIKCPFDGAILSLKYQPGMESKSVTCPICKHKYPFTQFTRVTPAPDGFDKITQYPNNNRVTQYPNDNRVTQYPNDNRVTQYPNDNGMTQYNNEQTEPFKENYTLGKVYIVGTDISFQLKTGRNVIGRKSANSTANIQIDTGDKRSMSREHIVIEVKKEPMKGFVHYLSLYKQKVNKTYVEEEQVVYGDNFVLSHGNIIKLPDATLKFIIPDDDGTDV